MSQAVAQSSGRGRDGSWSNSDNNGSGVTVQRSRREEVNGHSGEGATTTVKWMRKNEHQKETGDKETATVVCRGSGRNRR